MVRRIVFATLMLLAVCVAGYGNDKADAAQAGADKAVLAYAELFTTGESSNATAVGLSDKEKSEISKQLSKDLVDMFGNAVPLSDQSANAIAKKYQEKCNREMKFTATLKTDDAKQPVVELKVTVLSESSANADCFSALLDMNAKLRDGGATPDQIKANAEFQKLAVESFGKYIDSFVAGTERTFDVTCTKVNGHWAPANFEALKRFLLKGQQ